MAPVRTKALDELQAKMQGLDTSSLRYQILEKVKNFKTSWIELGQALYTAWKDKLYKEWGYHNFDAYTAKEIGIRKQTAMKLLRSYYFLEKEEPQYLNKEYAAAAAPVNLPTYEAIDLLRLARNKRNLDEDDYSSLKKSIFEQGKDVREVRRELSGLIRQRQDLEPEEAREKRRVATVRRLIALLKTVRQQAQTAKLLPAGLIGEVGSLIKKIEQEIA